MDQKSDLIKMYGLKLMVTKLKIIGDPMAFFRQVQIYKWDILKEMTGLKIIDNVLWMLMINTEGLRMPNGCRWFDYIPFFSNIYPKGKRYYRFTASNTEDDASKAWTFHSF